MTKELLQKLALYSILAIAAVFLNNLFQPQFSQKPRHEERSLEQDGSFPKVDFSKKSGSGVKISSKWNKILNANRAFSLRERLFFCAIAA